MGEKIKKGLLIAIFAILLLPLLQQQFPFIESGKLYGYFSNAGDVDFSWQKWFDGSYQKGKNDFHNDHVGFRPDFLRLNNQVDYSLYQKYSGVTLGTDNYLYYPDFIDAYYGRDFVGYKILHERMVKLKAIQDTLTKCGKTLIMVYNPCKAWYYPEHIPGNMKYHEGENNYLVSSRIGDSLGINQIDFNAWFLTMKKSKKNLLFGRPGIHWTNYGAILGGDSLIKYIEEKRRIRMVHPSWTKTEITTDAREPDNDLGGVLNLVFPVSNDTFCYPELQFKSDSATKKPKCIFIGDSFVINLIRQRIIQNAFSDWQLWFYLMAVFNDTTENADLDTKVCQNMINNTDCVILMYTPKNTKYIGNGIIEQMYDYYYPHK